MTRIKLLVVLVALLASGAATTATHNCQAGICMGIQPICLYPDHPVCLCQGISVTNCRWVCAH